MGVFDDKKLEQLDWMTQITETIESDLNGLLARLPDRFEITSQLVLENASSSRFSLHASSVVRDLLRKLPNYREARLDWDEETKICNLFKFETSGDLEFDAATGTLSGSIVLVKTAATLEDEELLTMMGAKGIQSLRRIGWENGEAPLDRMNEILDILGKCQEHMKNRSSNKKMHAIATRLKEIFTTNEWRIRDMELANKIGRWCAGYIKTGNLADLTNFCKLKVMTHNNMPIYSIEEEK